MDRHTDYADLIRLYKEVIQNIESRGKAPPTVLHKRLIQLKRIKQKQMALRQ